MLTDWPVGTILAIIVILATLAVVLVILCGIFTIIDSWFLPTQSGTGRITKKNFIPAHTTTTLISTGKTLMPMTSFYPNSWELELIVSGKPASMSIKKERYDSLNIGDTVLVDYAIGRFSKDIYIK